MTDNELIAEWLGWKGNPPFDADITLWHGSDGLLAEIDRKGFRQRFMYMLWNIAGVRESAMPDNGSDPVAWHFMQSTTAQLTTALVAVIKEE